MPKVAKLNTPAMQAHASAKAAHDAAKERDAKASTATTKKAVEDAAAKLATATTALNTERFSRVGSARASAAVFAIEQFGAVFNPRNYVYTKEQGERGFAEIRKAVDDQQALFVASLAPGAAKSGKVKKTIQL